ncbi:hypothetical protein RUND412_008447 [Rhizina undulata]
MSFSYNISDDHLLFGQSMTYLSYHDQDAYDYGSDELPVAASYTSNNQTIDPRLLTVDQAAIHSQYQGAEYTQYQGAEYTQYQGADYNPEIEWFQGSTPSNIPMLFVQNDLYYSHHDEYAYNYSADAFQVAESSNVPIDPMLLVVGQSGVTSQSVGGNFEQYDFESEEDLDRRLGSLFNFLTDEDASGSPDPEFVSQVVENVAEPEGPGEAIIGESPLQFAEEESDVSAQSTVTPVEPRPNAVKQKRTRIRKPHTKVAKEKNTRIPRAVARSSKKAVIDVGENVPDRACSHCHMTQSIKEYGCPTRYHSVCRTCREKRGVLGDAKSYCMACKKFKGCEEFTILPKKNKYIRSCNNCRKRDTENKRRRKQQKLAMAARVTTGAAEGDPGVSMGEKWRLEGKDGSAGTMGEPEGGKVRPGRKNAIDGSVYWDRLQWKAGHVL